MASVLTLLFGCDGNPKPPPVAEHTGVAHSGATTEVCAVPLEPGWPVDADPCELLAGGLYFEGVGACTPFWFRGEFLHAHFTFDSNWNYHYECESVGRVAHITGCFGEGPLPFTFDASSNLLSFKGSSYALVATDWQPHSGTTLDYYFYGYSGHYSTPSWCFPADSGDSGGP